MKTNITQALVNALSHRRTALGAMDFMLFFLFGMQPGLPAVPGPASFVAGGFACLGGIAVAIRETTVRASVSFSAT